MTAMATAVFSDDMLKQAVACMMGDIARGTTSPASLLSSTPARGDQLIAALYNITSLEQVVSYEEDLRGTLASREVTARGKIERLEADDECILEQSYLFLDTERDARDAIIGDYVATVAIPLALVSLAAAEEFERLTIALEYRAAVRQLRLCAAPLQLQQSEASARSAMEAEESLLRMETTQRRYMEIGECAQSSQYRCEQRQLHEEAWKYSTAFLSAARRLFAAEAADRESLDLMFLFHRATLTTQEKESRTVALRESVEWVSTHDASRAVRCIQPPP